MTERMSAADYRAQAAKPARSKYGNKRTEYNGRWYASNLEARYAATLDLRVKGGEIKAWAPQVSIPIPGTDSKRMVLDFMVVRFDGTVTWIDTKGAPPTRNWLLKKELVERGYGIKIEIIRSA